MTNKGHLIRFPKARYLLLPVILLISLFNHFVINQGILRPGIIAGLILDGVGAVLLAIPDVPLIWRRTFSGRLHYAKESLNQTGAGGFSTLNRPGIPEPHAENSTGFLEVLNVLEPILTDGLGDHTHDVFCINDDMDISDVDLIKITQAKDFGLFDYNPGIDVQGYAGWSGAIMSETTMFFLPKSRVDQRLTQEIEKQKSRIRRSGIGLLVTGFAQQILFTLPGVI